MSATYAGAKGRSVQAVAVKKPPLRPLTAEEQAKVAFKKAFVEENIPEAVPFIKELYAEGLIDGWRSVLSARLIEGDGDGTQ